MSKRKDEGRKEEGRNQDQNEKKKSGIKFLTSKISSVANKIRGKDRDNNEERAGFSEKLIEQINIKLNENGTVVVRLLDDAYANIFLDGPSAEALDGAFQRCFGKKAVMYTKQHPNDSGLEFTGVPADEIEHFFVNELKFYKTGSLIKDTTPYVVVETGTYEKTVDIKSANTNVVRPSGFSESKNEKEESVAGHSSKIPTPANSYASQVSPTITVPGVASVVPQEFIKKAYTVVLYRFEFDTPEAAEKFHTENQDKYTNKEKMIQVDPERGTHFLMITKNELNKIAPQSQAQGISS
ncbi:MAG: hypothetical protein IPP74_08450 [Alphaproteobacteria bacterium]|nr:hypothetical protein [Alphaproteobacteria bacterium]